MCRDNPEKFKSFRFQEQHRQQAELPKDREAPPNGAQERDMREAKEVAERIAEDPSELYGEKKPLGCALEAAARLTNAAQENGLLEPHPWAVDRTQEHNHHERTAELRRDERSRDGDDGRDR